MSQTSTNPLLLVLSAPSGGGKTTLCEQLLAADAGVARAITCTTRAPRAGERDGVHYHFLSAEAFERGVKAGEFLEHATVYGNHYGTRSAEVRAKLAAGKDVLLAIDVQGATAVRERARLESALCDALVTVFLTPPSMAVLEERLERRAQDSPSAMRQRLAVARNEIAQWNQFDYLILSTTVAEDLRRMQAVIQAERMRQRRATPPLMD